MKNHLQYFLVIITVSFTAFAMIPLAEADSKTFLDPAQDVTVYTKNYSKHWVAEKVKHGDLLSSNIQHNSLAVRVQNQYTELYRGMPAVQGISIKTSKGGEEKRVVIFTEADGGKPKIYVDSYDGWKCVHASAGVNYKTNRAWFRIPRRCLGYPKWVKVMVSSTSIDEKQRFRGDQLFLDGKYLDTDAPFSPKIWQ